MRVYLYVSSWVHAHDVVVRVLSVHHMCAYIPFFIAVAYLSLSSHVYLCYQYSRLDRWDAIRKTSDN